MRSPTVVHQRGDAHGGWHSKPRAGPSPVRAIDTCRTATLSPRAPELDGSRGSGRVLPQAIREIRDEDDLQRLRGRQDRQRLHPVHQGRDAAAERTDRPADLGVALRLEHAELARVQRSLSRDGPADRADVGRRGRHARRHVERHAAGFSDAGADSRTAGEGHEADAARRLRVSARAGRRDDRERAGGHRRALQSRAHVSRASACARCSGTACTSARSCRPREPRRVRGRRRLQDQRHTRRRRGRRLPRPASCASRRAA